MTAFTLVRDAFVLFGCASAAAIAGGALFKARTPDPQAELGVATPAEVVEDPSAGRQLRLSSFELIERAKGRKTKLVVPHEPTSFLQTLVHTGAEMERRAAFDIRESLKGYMLSVVGPCWGDGRADGASVAVTALARRESDMFVAVDRAEVTEVLAPGLLDPASLDCVRDRLRHLRRLKIRRAWSGLEQLKNLVSMEQVHLKAPPRIACSDR